MASQNVSLDLMAKYGPLTSRLQTRASIVLSQIGRNGMFLDQYKVIASLDRLKGRVSTLVEQLSEFRPPIFGTYKSQSIKKVKGKYWQGSLLASGKADVPKICKEHL